MSWLALTFTTETACRSEFDVFEKWRGDGFFGGSAGAVFTFGFAGTHHRDAALAHDGFDVFEVGVDNAQFLDDGGDAVHGVAQDVIHGFEGADEGCVFAHDGGDAVVRDDDEAIDLAFQHFQPRFGFAHARHAFKGKRFGDDGDGEDAHVARDVGDDGCGAGTGTATHASGDEDHVGAV